MRVRESACNRLSSSRDDGPAAATGIIVRREGGRGHHLCANARAQPTDHHLTLTLGPVAIYLDTGCVFTGNAKIVVKVGRSAFGAVSSRFPGWLWDHLPVVI